MSETTTPPPREGREGWVYFCSDGQAIKIGWSQKPEDRPKALATGNPRPLTILAQIPGTQRDEKLLHKLLAPYRTRPTGEWFHARKPILALVGWAQRHGHAVPEPLPRLGGSPRYPRSETGALESEIGAVAYGLHADYKAVKQAVRAHVDELHRAIDQTDDHEGLSDAVRAAALALATLCHGPKHRHIDAIFDGIASLWHLAGEVEDDRPDEADGE